MHKPNNSQHMTPPTQPFQVDGYVYRDSEGHLIVTCDDTSMPPCSLYREKYINDNPHFICPHCGRIGIRMEYATHKQIEHYEHVQ